MIRRHVLLWTLLTLGLTACGSDGQSAADGQSSLGTSSSDPAAATAPPSQAATEDPPAPAPPVDSAPTIEGVPAASVNVGSAYLFAPTAADPNHDSLTFSIANMPTWAAFDPTSGKLSGAPTSADVGVFTNITISVSDGQQSASIGPFQITVVAQTPTPPKNNPPVISGSPMTTTVAGQAYSFTPTASDPDGDTLSFTIANKPAWATFSSTTGKLSGTPSTANEKTYTAITISVSDGQATAALPAFSIAVTAPPNHPPTISGTPPTSVVAGSAYTFKPTASDADGNTLTFSIQNRPTWATFSTATGQLSGTPTSAGTFTNIVISVSDGKASASLSAFTITVTAASGGGGGSGSTNTPPVISGTPPTSGTVGTAYSFTPTASDANGDPLTFSIQNMPTWAAFNTNTGALTGTPTSSNIGTSSNIIISVSDGKATTALAGFSITVASPVASGTATVTWTAPTTNSDGTALTNLAGFNVYWGTVAGNLNQSMQVPGSGSTTYTVTNLSSGTWYFAVASYTTSGAQSALSTVSSKAIQ